jgi:hypothetical protein
VTTEPLEQSHHAIDCECLPRGARAPSSASSAPTMPPTRKPHLARHVRRLTRWAMDCTLSATLTCELTTLAVSGLPATRKIPPARELAEVPGAG